MPRCPQLPEADVASFLQIEAERSFPCDVATLVTATSLCQAASGQRHAAIHWACPRNQIATLEAVLRAAQLKPESFSLGITALQPADRDGALALTIGESHVGLQVTCGGGVVALRALEGAMETEGGRRTLRGDLVAREARITLGQLPEELRATVRQVRVFGPRDLAQQLADEMQRRLAVDESAGESWSRPTRRKNLAFSCRPKRRCPPRSAWRRPDWSVAAPHFELSAARKFRRGSSSPPAMPRASCAKPGRWPAAVLLLVVAAFGFQQIQLWRLQSRWAGMQVRVGELETMQQQIRQYRPWFDESLRSLSILRQLTTAFPEDGVVTAKTVEIRDANLVTCTGTARDNASLLRTLEQVARRRQRGRFESGPDSGQVADAVHVRLPLGRGRRHAN